MLRAGEAAFVFGSGSDGFKSNNVERLRGYDGGMIQPGETR
jgi:hypothetical protein